MGVSIEQARQVLAVLGIVESPARLELARIVLGILRAAADQV